MTIKELRAKRAKLVEDARALVNAEPNGMSVENDAKFNAIMAEADTVKKQYENLERLAEVEGELGQPRNGGRGPGRELPQTEDEIRANNIFERDVLNHYLRFGMRDMNEEFRAVAARRFQAAQGSGSDAAGGYTVPELFQAQIESAQKAFGGMFEVAYTFTTSNGNELPIPTDNDTENEGALIGQNPPSITEAANVDFGSIRLGAHTYTSKMLRVSNQLLQDSAFDIMSFLAGKLGTRLARIENRHATTGDGASKPHGIVNASTLGVTAAAADISMDNMIELHHSVDPAYRPTARFMFNDATLLALKKKKDGQGRWLWQSGIAIKEPDTIDGKPYTINQHMASIGSGNYPVIFGDFSKYYIRRVAGTMVRRLEERFAELNQTAFVAFERMDGGLVDAGTHPIKSIKNA